MDIADNVVLILGGTSDIGRMTALAFAKRGWTVQLAGRDLDGLDREARNIAARTGVKVSVHEIDVLDTGRLKGFIQALPALPHTTVSVVGVLGDQPTAENDFDHATTIMRSNFEGPALLLGEIANFYLARGRGTIVGVSSVAGERGRASNYVYGAAKAGFTAFLSGLRNRCSSTNIHILTVKPGFVRTKMTQHLQLPGALTLSPEAMGEKIVAAALARKDVVYSTISWFVIMSIIKALPETIFKRLKL